MRNNSVRYTDPTGHCDPDDCRWTANDDGGWTVENKHPDTPAAKMPAQTGGNQQPDWGTQGGNANGDNPGGHSSDVDTRNRARRDLTARTIAVGGTAQGTLGIISVQGNLVLLVDRDGNAALVLTPAGGVGVGLSGMVGATVQVTNADNIDMVINSDRTFYMGASAGEILGGGVDVIVGRDLVGLDFSAGVPFGPIPFETHAVDSPGAMTIVIWRGKATDFVPAPAPYNPDTVFPFY